ncbi:MAG TPA: multidrug transporter, partial [Actinopolymorphaceae bacterium]
AHLIETWLSAFQLSTGKGAAFVGAHVGRFHASRVDGVPYLVNGNAGKTPSSEPGDGGFSGWSLIGVEPIGRGEQEQARRFPFRGGPTWISAELRPHVDALTIAAPDEVVVGSDAEVSAEVLQGERRVPVGYPMSARWRGGPRVHIGPVEEARRSDVAAFDPATGLLTGLRAGTATLSVTVNDTTESVTVPVARPRK